MTTVSDAELLAALPDTLIDHDNKEFYRGWLEHRLVINRSRVADIGTIRLALSAPSAGHGASSRPR